MTTGPGPKPPKRPKLRELALLDVKSWVKIVGCLLVILPPTIFFLEPFAGAPGIDAEENPGQKTAQFLWAHAGEVLTGTPAKVGLVMMVLGVVLLAVAHFLPD